ncbi:hypothetical protein GX50_07748 [[Emmonsia] crescens]|uniref:Uncharacterized protein n=1 Tax=[Emmonsia] crescens TaxID=73230 RepID=A0A2B7Z8G8_9EURO|nr:hypothetical protein GX50_07748 [Emmonsia crescens]
MDIAPREIPGYYYGGKLLQRESGTLPTSRSFVTQQRAAACAGLYFRNRLIDVSSYDTRFPVSRFARDPWSGNLLVAINTASNFNLLVSSSSPTGESVHVSTSRLTNQLDGRPASQYVVDTATTFCYPGSMVWCSAACPSAAESIFAAGKSNDLLLITGIESSWSTRAIEMSVTADVMAVEWLTPRVVMSGMANSLVQFYDLRSRDTASRLQHPHGVYKIRKVDEWRVVVAGAKKNLHMYDLRYTPSGITTRPQPNKLNHTSTKPYLSFPDYANDHISHDELDISPEIGLLACSSPSNRIQLFSLNTGKLIMPAPFPFPYLPSVPKPPPATPPSSTRIKAQAHQREAVEVYNPNPNRPDIPITHYPYPGEISCLRFENLEEVPTANGGGNTGKPSLLVSAGCMVEEWRM